MSGSYKPTQLANLFPLRLCGFHLPLKKIKREGGNEREAASTWGCMYALKCIGVSHSSQSAPESDGGIKLASCKLKNGVWIDEQAR